ncbi:MAG: YXWGXW repeat-containing protein [Deltaproteobacteria bacterium]|nr:YXWGXW repeat-containing protein [Deltaproteobacteria bacterium]
MNGGLIRYLRVWAVPVWLGLTLGAFPALAVQEDTPEAEKGVNVLATGPIHEAFAETVAFDPEPGIFVSKAPPDPINEIPPEHKPEGEDVEWIPGYWAWDDDRNDFIWVSGIWRAIPPDRQWIPGYWFKRDKGFQWVSGYWARDKERDMEYLPEPPESVEVGPNVSAPSSEYTWIPGCWIWVNGRYAWRPGYWAAMRPDWVWMPAHYVWSPRGYIFVRGYWDFAVTHRGVLFAPVFFDFGVAVAHGFYFRPSFVIDLRVFSDCLFLRPRYHHYYFGDYYAPRYYRKGIFPWFSPHVRRHGYDPIYAHQRWKHRHDRGWENHVRATYQARRAHEAVRPPRRLHHAEKSEHGGKMSPSRSHSAQMGFQTVKKSQPGSSRFQLVSKKERMEINHRREQIRNYTHTRQKWETQVSPSTRGTKSNKVKLPESPISSKRPHGGNREKAPSRYQIPEPNSTVEPLQRRSPGYGERNHTGASESRDLDSEVRSPESAPQVNRGKDPSSHYRAPKSNPAAEPRQRSQGNRGRSNTERSESRGHR